MKSTRQNDRQMKSPTTRPLRRDTIGRSVSTLVLILASVASFGLLASTQKPLADTSLAAVDQSVNNSWAGYVAGVTSGNEDPGSVTSVSGQWTVPTVVCTDAPSHVAYWVGIDGYTAAEKILPQIGIQQACSSTGVYSSAAWYEMWPDQRSVFIPVPFKPGDVVAARVQAHGATSYTLTLANDTSGTTYSTTQRPPSGFSGLNETADWIVECYHATGGAARAGLADFGSVTFRNTALDNSMTWPSTEHRVSQVMKTKDLLASPSALSGNSFTVTWFDAK
jgi:hypothetical protein